jgi:methylated-DNA-protein-cysteine methyltransferase related protein
MVTKNDADLLVSRAFALVRACPRGRVTTYSWIARALGYPRGARMLGWIMGEAVEGVPAQRVINSKGELTGSHAFGPPGVMRQMLEQEGIVFSDDGRVDLKRYGWDPARDLSAQDLEALLTTASSAHPVVAGEGLLRLLGNDPASPLRAPSSSEPS